MTQLALAVNFGDPVMPVRKERPRHTRPQWRQLAFVWISRPRTWGECQAMGLGSSVPCPFAACPKSLLVDWPRFGLQQEALRSALAKGR